MSWDKATSSSEEIKPVALSIAKLHLAEGIRYLGSKIVSQLLEILVK